MAIWETIVKEADITIPPLTIKQTSKLIPRIHSTDLVIITEFLCQKIIKR